MLISSFEIKSASINNPELIQQLLEKCEIHADLSNLKNLDYANQISDQIENFVNRKLNSEDILSALRKLLNLAEIQEPTSMNIPGLIDEITKNESIILNRF